MSTESFDKDRVLARVKKMMTLANDAAATEGERDNALRMAHATLAKYNLSISEADAVGTPEQRLIDGIDVGGLPWMLTTAQAVANLFFCKIFVTRLRGGKVQTYFVGKESNVSTAQGMAKYVIDSINKEARRAARENGESSSGTYWRSFCKGAAHRVYHRCEEIRRTAEQALAIPSNGTALVLASVYKNELMANTKLIEDQYGKLGKSRSSERNTSGSAYAAGREYGDKIGLNNQIGGSSANHKQLT